MRAILKSFNFNFKLLKLTYGKRYDDQRNIFSRNPRKINIAPKSPICSHPYHILKKYFKNWLTVYKNRFTSNFRWPFS